MATRAEKIRLGIFLAVALLLLAATLAALIGPRLWETLPRYSIRFHQNVSGLDEGSPVKMRGVRVGQVSGIRIAPNDVEVVEVWIEVDSGTPVKKDHRAVISLQGITGLKFIQLEGGSHEAQRLRPGGEIQEGENLFTQLTGDVSDISAKLAELLNQLLIIVRPENQRRFDSILATADRASQDFEQLIGSVDAAVRRVDAVLEKNEEPLHRAIVSIGTTSQHVDRTLGEVDSSLSQIRSTIDAAEVPATTEEIRATSAMARTKLEELELQQVVQSAVEALTALERVLRVVEETVDQNDESVRRVIDNLRRASENLKDITRTFQEKPLIQVFGDNPKERKLP